MVGNLLVGYFFHSGNFRIMNDDHLFVLISYIILFHLLCASNCNPIGQLCNNRMFLYRFFRHYGQSTSTSTLPTITAGCNTTRGGTTKIAATPARTALAE